MMWPKK